jgi:hypothetical protein
LNEIIGNILIAVLLGSFVCLIGYSLLILTNLTACEKRINIALAWWLGFACIAQQLFFYSLFSIPWDMVTVLPLECLLILAALLKIYKTGHGLSIAIDWQIFFFAILSVVAVHISLNSPVWDLDGWQIWNFKAQIFFHDGMISRDFLRETQFPFAHMDYPIGLPLVQTWSYILMGTINMGVGKFIYLFSYFTLALCVSTILHTVGVRTVYATIISTVFCTSLNIIHSHQLNYADILIGQLFLLALCIDQLNKTRGHEINRVIPLVLLSIAAFIKLEGIIFLLTYLLFTVFPLRMPKQWKQIRWVAMSLLLWLPWILLTHYWGVQSDPWLRNIQISFIVENLHRIPIILSAFLLGHNGINSAFGYVWFFYFTFLIYHNISKTCYRKNFNLIFFVLIEYLSFYFFTTRDLEWHLRTSLSRLLLQLYLPVFMFVCMSIFYSKKPHITTPVR